LLHEAQPRGQGHPGILARKKNLYNDGFPQIDHYYLLKDRLHWAIL
jgi:hypothetical protein